VSLARSRSGHLLQPQGRHQQHPPGRPPTTSQIIVLATPVFLLLIALEYAVGRARGRNTYRLNDALSSLGLGMLSQVSGGVHGALLRLGIYALCYEHLALARWPSDAVWTWVVALVFYDFCYYWFHRASHEVAVLWAAHVVHHQSEDYNLSTALRQPSTSFLLGWIFYLPMALAGVPPLVFAVVALIDLLYQYWVHTQQIGRLGWFDRWFCSPSNHRVHHAVNERYLDRNHGGIFMIWDRLFGTFIEEDDVEPVRLRHARRCAASTRCGPTCRSTVIWPRTPGTHAPGPTSWVCCYARRAGGRPMCSSGSRARLSTSTACRRTTRR
jgi:sterol desaturase/sphingolipid hydroxylase (fatty acid hydroxylase superfamily)